MVRNAEDDVFWGVADEDGYGRQVRLEGTVVLKCRFDAVSEKFSNNVLQMREDVGKCSIEVPLDPYLRHRRIGTVCVARKTLGIGADPLDHLLCVTVKENLANIFAVLVCRCVGEVEGRVESVGQG